MNFTDWFNRASRLRWLRWMDSGTDSTREISLRYSVSHNSSKTFEPTPLAPWGRTSWFTNCRRRSLTAPMHGRPKSTSQKTGSLEKVHSLFYHLMELGLSDIQPKAFMRLAVTPPTILAIESAPELSNWMPNTCSANLHFALVEDTYTPDSLFCKDCPQVLCLESNTGLQSVFPIKPHSQHG